MKGNLSRRAFLQKAAVISSASSMLSSDAIASSKQTGNPSLKLGLMTWNLAKEWDIETIINNCSQTQFMHVELRTTHEHGVEISLNKQQRNNVKKRFEDSPLEAISLASGYAYHYPDQDELRQNIEDTKAYLQLAADIGAQGIRVFPNALPEAVDREKTIEQIGKSLSELGDFGYNLGVQVRVEEHGKGTDSIPVIKEILDYADSKHVYIVWNSLPNDVKGEGLEAHFNMVKDRIGCIHLHELSSDYPYRQLFRLLRKVGYNGYCDAELRDPSCEPIRMMDNYRALFFALQNEM